MFNRKSASVIFSNSRSISFNRLISTSQIRYSNAEEVEKLNALLKQKMAEIEEAEKQNRITQNVSDKVFYFLFYTNSF